MEDARNSSHDDSVYGGEMTQGEFYYAEFQIEEDYPNWQVEAEGTVFNMTVNGQPLELRYDNTIIYMFDDEFEWFSHIYYQRGEGQKPLYIMIPEDEEYMESFLGLMDQMVCAGFKLRTQAYPEPVDFETMHKRLRGGEEIEEIIGKILLEGINDD